MYKLVITDDEWLIREGLKHTIDWAAIGCEVVAEASNGEEALQAVRVHRPDILLTDIRMPGTSGLELAREAREEYPGLKIIFLTGFDDFAYAQQAIKLQASDFVLKPTDPDELVRIVSRICSQIGQERQAQDSAEEQHGIVREKLLQDLMLGIADSKAMLTVAQLLDPQRLERAGFRVAYSEQDGRPAEASHLERVTSLLQPVLYAGAVKLDSRRTAWLLADDDGQAAARLLEATGEERAEAATVFGLSLRHPSLATLREAYLEAESALRSKRPGASRTVWEYGDIAGWSGQELAGAGGFGPVEAYLRQKYAEDISLQELAARFHMSEAHFSRMFRKRTGHSYMEYVTGLRLEQAKRLLLQPQARIYEVSLAVGYQDARYFSQIFRKYTGETPTEYRRNHGDLD
ncbi:response regulator [Paenibacillus filicis]|uniref:Response regulator n=1 Tax=Paenibacillus filicis TaxID=669464 RepID=A0ABU9DM57_9BACL